MAIAVARPMPREAPVTSPTRPSNFIVVLFPLVRGNRTVVVRSNKPVVSRTSQKRQDRPVTAFRRTIGRDVSSAANFRAVVSAGKTGPASAGLLCVGVGEGEPTLFQAVVPVDRCAVEEQQTLAIHSDSQPVLGRDIVGGFVDLVIECQAVLETTTATAVDSDSQNVFVDRQALFFEGASPLRRGLLGNHDSHRITSVP